MRALACLLFIVVTGCNSGGRGGFPFGTDGNHALGDGGGGLPTYDFAGSKPQSGCGAEFTGCYTVYAHADHVLYHVDLVNKLLVEVGPFNAPMVSGQEDVITDLAVAPDDTIYVVSKTHLYTADHNDGHVTQLGALSGCGNETVALTFTPDDKLYAADFKGAFCQIDITTTPPTVKQIGMLGGGLAIAGDLVAVGDGTMYGTAYRLSDASNMGTQASNLLVTIDPASGLASSPIGATGFPKLFGVAYAQGQVFGFTHDGTGHVVTIDPKSGQGTVYNAFNDPQTNKPISFAGAGVNAMVAPSVQ